MPALFSRSAGRLFRILIVVGIALAVGIPVLLMAWVRTPPATGQHSAPAQPVEFSHQLHAGAFRIDCRYCHTTVERAATAGMPATETCVPCHQPVWYNGPFFAPVRQSLATGKPIPWQRVNDLPDYVFFNHAIHIRKGVACETCHGRVDQMARVEQAAPLTMGWCLDCHRNPAPHLRPRSAVTTMGWTRPADSSESGAALARRYAVKPVTDCSACHR
ncbi:MAG TPA: cytochrome c3 family protein [Gemmatimonadales bacterium]|nr:cytochrome c3 family protein [Gemmatimonadales bacterium]